jgi:hypothetical protein
MHGLLSCRNLVVVNVIGAFRPGTGCFVQSRARCGYRDGALGYASGAPLSYGMTAIGVPDFFLQIKIHYILC